MDDDDLNESETTPRFAASTVSSDSDVGDYSQHAERLALSALRVFPEERSEEDLTAILSWLRRLPPIFARFFNLCFNDYRGQARSAKERARQMCRTLKLINLTPGTIVYKQGDVGASFYIILHGACDVYHHPLHTVDGFKATPGSTFGEAGTTVPSGAAESFLGVKVGVLGSGECMGGLPDRFGGFRPASTLASASARGKTQILQFDNTCYEESVAPILSVVEREVDDRVALLSRMHLFSGWPTDELFFFAYWMHEARFEAGEPLYTEGDRTDRLHILVEGSVELKDPSQPSGEVVLERLRPPSMCGLVDTLRRWRTRRHTAVALEDAIAFVVPVALFRKLVLSDAAAAVLPTSERVEVLVDGVDDWHRLRVAEAGEAALAGVGVVGYALVETVQDRFLPCGWCGVKGHPSEECPLADQSPIRRPAPPSPAAWAPETLATTGRGSSSRLLKPRLDALRDAAPSPAARARTPMGARRPRVRSVTGDNWLDSGSPESVSPAKGKQDAAMHSAVQDLGVIKRAVNSFRRLVARRFPGSPSGIAHSPPAPAPAPAPPAARLSSSSVAAKTAPVPVERGLAAHLTSPVVNPARKAGAGVRSRSSTQDSDSDDVLVAGSLKLRPKAQRLQRGHRSLRGRDKLTPGVPRPKSLRSMGKQWQSAGAKAPFTGAKPHTMASKPQRRTRAVSQDFDVGEGLPPKRATSFSALIPNRNLVRVGDDPATAPGNAGVDALPPLSSPSLLLDTQSHRVPKAAAPPRVSAVSSALRQAPPQAQSFGAMGYGAAPPTLAAVGDVVNPLGPATVDSPGGLLALQDSPIGTAFNVAAHDREHLRPWKLDSPERGDAEFAIRHSASITSMASLDDDERPLRVSPMRQSRKVVPHAVV